MSQPSDYAKQVFTDLGLGKYSDLALVATKVLTEDGLVDCDVVVVVRELPTEEKGGDIQPLLMVVDKRNQEYIQPVGKVRIAGQEPSSAPPDAPEGLATPDDGEPPAGTQEAEGDGTAP